MSQVDTKWYQASIEYAISFDVKMSKMQTTYRFNPVCHYQELEVQSYANYNLNKKRTSSYLNIFHNWIENRVICSNLYYKEKLR